MLFGDSARIERLEQRLRRQEQLLEELARKAGIDVTALRASTDLSAEEQLLLSSGRKIHAIKEYRRRTGAGLREAKDAVEAAER